MIVFPKKLENGNGKIRVEYFERSKVKQSKTDAYRFLKILMKTERKGNEKKVLFLSQFFPHFLDFLYLKERKEKGGKNKI
jgi:hypothetical protein